MPNVIEIKDYSRPELDVYARLTETQLRSESNGQRGMFIAESRKVIEYALDAGYEPVSLLMEQKHIEGQAREIIGRCGGIPVYTGSRELLAGLTGYEMTRGILCAMKRRQPAAAETVCADAERIAVLENIGDPTNIGAIFRSAAALGMDAVLLTESCCDPLYRRTVRVSMGTVFQIPWSRIGNNCAERLRDLGFKTAALALHDDSLSIDDPELAAQKRLAVVLGSEGSGLSQETIDGCDYTVRIPMSRHVDSLNVAAAGAVAFWQLGRH